MIFALIELPYFYSLFFPAVNDVIFDLSLHLSDYNMLCGYRDLFCHPSVDVIPLLLMIFFVYYRKCSVLLTELIFHIQDDKVMDVQVFVIPAGQ